MYVKDSVLCRARQCGTMVDVSQVMIVHTIICQIHVSSLTTHLSNELNWTWICTEILTLLTMKLELPSPLLSDSPFLTSNVFLFYRFSNLTVEWTKWSNPLSEWKIHKNFRQKPRPKPDKSQGQKFLSSQGPNENIFASWSSKKIIFECTLQKVSSTQTMKTAIVEENIFLPGSRKR
jgi:hypothetical protein